METYQDFEHSKDGNMSYLYDWVFHYNHYNNTWAAIPRDVYAQYWDKYDLPGVIRSSKIETLLELLHKSKGDIDLLNEMVKP
jgi:hypothetical protein